MNAEATQQLTHMAMLVGIAKAMPREHLAELEEWEREHLDGETGTSDWPGWALYYGAPPLVFEPRRERGKRRQIPTSTRIAVYRRDGFACRSCGTTENLGIDHIVPVARGGTDDEPNLQSLCGSCNSRKGAR